MLDHGYSRILGAHMMHQAATAVVLRDTQAVGGLELLFIQRAEHPKDPWSGHMAFPGGRVDPDDDGPFAAALRETEEELSLNLLKYATPIGRLSHQLAKAHGKMAPMIITPYVFALREMPTLKVAPDEVQEALWIPLSYLEDPSNKTTCTQYFKGVPMNWPCYHYDQRTIWGLTFKMLGELMRALGHKR